MEKKIHKDPIDFIDIPAPQHSEEASYRICYGEVDWFYDGNLKEAIYVVMKYGNKIAYRRVAHILITANPGETESDFDKVYDAINQLKIKHKL